MSSTSETWAGFPYPQDPNPLAHIDRGDKPPKSVVVPGDGSFFQGVSAFHDEMAKLPFIDPWHAQIMGSLPVDALKGVKYDAEKPQWDLLPWQEVQEVVEVLTYGAKKYSPDNWQRVNDSRSRYFAAAMRHVVAWFNGEKRDAESGKSHLAHAICCLLFLMWFDRKTD